jgi:hypothetical protein
MEISQRLVVAAPTLGYPTHYKVIRGAKGNGEVVHRSTVTITKNVPAAHHLFDVNPRVRKVETTLLKRRAFRRDRWRQPSVVSHPAILLTLIGGASQTLQIYIGRLGANDRGKDPAAAKRLTNGRSVNLLERAHPSATERKSPVRTPLRAAECLMHIASEIGDLLCSNCLHRSSTRADNWERRRPGRCVARTT